MANELVGIKKEALGSRLRRVWRRTSRVIAVLTRTAGLLSTVLTILAFLGLSTVGFGFVSHILPLIIIGIAIIIVTILLCIFFYTLLEEKTKPVAPATFTNVITLPSPSVGEERTKPISTDTIKYPPPPPEVAEILRKELVYEYLPDGKTMYQRKHLKMQMLQNDITHFKDRYRWTGSGTCIVRSLTPGFEITNQHKEEGGIWDYFDVTFPHPMHRDDIIEFTVEWMLVDEEKTAVPFLSTMIDRETKYLLLQVNLPYELAPKRAYFHEYANYIDTLPIDTRKVNWSPATKCLTYEVLQPKKYHKYQIRWYSE